MTSRDVPEAGRIIPLTTVVLYLALGIAPADGQVPQSQAPQEQPSHPKLSQAEVSELKTKAEHGDVSAQWNLGKAYEVGNRVPQSDELAAKWYRKAADQGNADAENSLGVMYRLGQGVNRDKEEAVRWYRKAAKLGNSQAMFNMGVSYYNGDGVPSNAGTAYAWFLLAQEAGSAAAEDAVTRSAEEGGRMGTPDAFLQIGEMYEKGADLPQSDSEAVKWYRKAADANPLARVRLAAMFINGRGVPRDYEQATVLCQSAARQNYAPGQFCVGYIHEHGLGSQADPKEAAKWYRLASAGGNVPAMMVLGEMYSKGEGMGLDRPEACYFFFLAARKGALDAKTRAQALWKEMSGDEIKHFEKKLRDARYDPHAVFAFMQDQTAPDAPGPSRP
jgi:TPR repeat protein